MKHLVLGRGQVGTAVTQLFGITLDEVDSWDLLDEEPHTKGSFDILHVCIPYSKDFVAEVKVHQRLAKHTIIYSTVPIGTCKKLKAVHSPIEGKHPKLYESLWHATRWMGSTDTIELGFFNSLFLKLGMHTRMVTSSNYTEALKLLSTAEYGINIAFAQYKADVAKGLGMPFELTKQWNQDYNDLYWQLGLEKQFQKFVLESPHGKIGGHCVIPNAEMLDQQYPSEFLKIIERFK